MCYTSTSRCRFLFREYFARVFLYMLRLERQFERQLVMQQRAAALQCAPPAGAVGIGKTPAAGASQSRLVSFLSHARSLLSGGRRKKAPSESLAVPPASAVQCQCVPASPGAAAERMSRSSSSARRVCSSSELQQTDATRKISNTASTASSSNARSSITSSASVSASASASAPHSRTSTATSSCCADPLEPQAAPAESVSDLSASDADVQAAVALDALATLAPHVRSAAVDAGSTGETAASTAVAERELLCCEPDAAPPSAAPPLAGELAAQSSLPTASNSAAERSLAQILPVIADEKYEKKLRKALRLNSAEDLRLIRVCLVLCTQLKYSLHATKVRIYSSLFIYFYLFIIAGDWRTSLPRTLENYCT